ncbi:hypothetical protein HMSSN036_58130 [Paenibacillus macerans]|nr:hypothetical protein HMSSN036_58130 [Paenibacillus macerans]
MLAIGKLLGAYVLPGLSRSFEQWLIRVQGAAPVQPDPYAIWPLNVEQPLWHSLLWTAPHSASTFQTLTGLGAALLVLGLACLRPEADRCRAGAFRGSRTRGVDDVRGTVRRDLGS